MVLPRVIVSHYHGTLSQIKGHFLQLFEEVEDSTIYTKYNLYVPKEPDQPKYKQGKDR